MNQNSYNSNSPGFDQPQPPQSPVIHQPPQEMSIQEMDDLKQKYLDEMKCLINSEYRDEIKIVELKQNFNGMSIEINKKEKLQQLEQWANLSTYPSKHFNSFCYDDDDEDYTIAVTPTLSTEEPDNSLSMGDEHLDTIPATESNEFIKSSVENLIPIPSESEGIPDNMCDVPFHDNSSPLDVSKDQFEDFFESNDEFSSTDDDSFSIDNIDYVEALPPDSELVSSEVMEIVIPEVGGIDDDILLTIKDDILCEKLLNINLLIAKIEALNDLHPHFDNNPLSGSTTYSTNSLLEEFTDELALITYPPEYDDNLYLKDSIDQTDLANLDDYFVDPIPEMFTDEHTPDYSSPPIFDVYDDDFLEFESDADNVFDDPFDSKEEKIKESKLSIDELDIPCDFLPYSEYDSFNSQDFSRVDVLPSTNNEDKVFNPGILIHEKPVKIITPVVQDKKLAISNASLVLEDFDPPFYDPLFFKDVPKSKMLLLFSSENEEKVFKPGIYTSEKVKEKQENDKIGTKPDQIKIKREAWKSPALSKSSHSQESIKREENTNLRDQKWKP
nr:hypothetical protein [Tanacetum cinerariifolium]